MHLAETHWDYFDTCITVKYVKYTFQLRLRRIHAEVDFQPPILAMVLLK